MSSRAVRGSVGVVFSQIYHQIDKDQFSHNWYQCTLPRVGFLTYSGAIFCGHRFGRLEILKKLIYFLNFKLGFQA